MCTDHDEPAVSRRKFTGLALAGAGMSLMPFRVMAQSSTADALCLMCIDLNFVTRAVKFFDDTLKLRGKYDLVGLAGASLAGVGPAFPAENAAFWNQVAIAKQLHGIKKIVVLDHRHCGAFKEQFGSYVEGDAELNQHRDIMRLFGAELARRKLGLGVEYYLMPVTPGDPVPVRP